MDSSDLQIELIRRLFSEAERRGIPLWLESGRAIDARPGRVTRDHEDVDAAYAKEREGEETRQRLRERAGKARRWDRIIPDPEAR